MASTALPVKFSTYSNMSEHESPSKKVTSLRKMVRGARKAMERKTAKSSSKDPSRTEAVRLPPERAKSCETLPLSDAFGSEHSATSHRSVSSQRSIPVSPIKSESMRVFNEKDYASPVTKPEKLTYIVHDDDIPHLQSSPNKYGSPKKQFTSPMKYGSPQKFSQSPSKQHLTKPYVSMKCIPYASNHEDEDEDEQSNGSLPRSRLLQYNGNASSCNSLNSSWSTLEPMNGHAMAAIGQHSRRSLTRSESTSSLQSTNSMVSWGDLSIGSLNHPNDSSGNNSIPLMIGLSQYY